MKLFILKQPYQSSLAKFLLLIFVCQLSYATPEDDGQKGIEAFKAGDLPLAVEHLNRAANDGYAPAQSALAYILNKSGFNLQAFELYQQAADQGDTGGILGLGLMHYNGDGVEQNINKGVELIKKAAEMNDPAAIYQYAGMLSIGSPGFDQDTKTAVDLFKKAASMEHHISIGRLVAIYRNGQLGETVNPELADKYQAQLSELNKTTDNSTQQK